MSRQPYTAAQSKLVAQFYHPTLGYYSRTNPCASSCLAQFSTAEANNSRSVRPVGSFAWQSRVCFVSGLTILIAKGAGPELQETKKIATPKNTTPLFVSALSHHLAVVRNSNVRRKKLRIVI